jgi:transposase
LQADGYAGFAQLYATGTIEEAACWAHARRKFYDVYKDQASPLAAEALKWIAALYVIESEIRGQPLDLRKAIRQSRAGPLLEQLHAWLNQTLTQLSKKSALGGAILYALNRWQALTRYAMTAESKSTTTPPNRRCAPLRWVAKTTCLPVPMLAENERQRSTAWWVLPS